MKTLLQLASAVATEIQIPPPATIVGLTDSTPRRMLRYANKAVETVGNSVNWTVLRAEQTFTSVAGSEQTGAIPSDYGRMVPETLWNRTDRVIIHGPIPAHQWQRLAAQSSTPFPTFTIRGGSIFVLPEMTAGKTLAFEYVSNHVVESSGGTGQTSFQADTDVNRLDDELVILAMVVDWLAAESQPFEMAMALYRNRLTRLAMQDNPTAGILYTDVPSSESYYNISTDWIRQ